MAWSGISGEWLLDGVLCGICGKGFAEKGQKTEVVVSRDNVVYHAFHDLKGETERDRRLREDKDKHVWFNTSPMPSVMVGAIRRLASEGTPPTTEELKKLLGWRREKVLYWLERCTKDGLDDHGEPRKGVLVHVSGPDNQDSRWLVRQDRDRKLQQARGGVGGGK